MRYTVTAQVIQVIGSIWMPSTTAAMEKTLSPYDMENLGDPRDREAVRDWIDKNFGDFQNVTDFRADFTVGDESIVHEWEHEESEYTFTDCMYPQED